MQGGNEIGDEGVKFIGEALKVNTSVQSLDLVSYYLFYSRFEILSPALVLCF